MTELEDKIRVELDAEIINLVKSQKVHDASAFDSQKKHDALGKKKKRTEVQDTELEKLHGNVMKSLNAGLAIAQRLKELKSPGEYERRVERARRKINDQQTQKERRSQPKPGAPKKLSAKEQGIPDVYLAESGNFKAGYDSKLKADLVASALKIRRSEALHKFAPLEAIRILELRDWMKYLNRKKK